jgi:RNA polymerase subunit RPABC4/transcription elongation factor Spt4
MKMKPCPSCGFLVFSELPGSYDICPICGWEDDDVQLKWPGLRIGANSICLYESQQIILNEIPLDIEEHKGYVRDTDWRPLSEEELKIGGEYPKDGLEYFREAGEICNRGYYWKRAK